MMRKSLLALSSVLMLAVGFGLTEQESSAKSKTWTVTERSEALKKDIASGQKSGDLTAKQADDLRIQAGKIDSKMVKMKAKNDGKISVDDQNTLEKDLNKLSLRMQKLKLDKRVQKQ